jgi:hypothetical protein
MDAVTITAVVVASVSVLSSVLIHDSLAMAVGHAIALLVPLVIIAFPESIDSGFRSTFRGLTHDSGGPTPGILLRVAAWALLIAVVVVHHSVGVRPIPPQPPPPGV